MKRMKNVLAKDPHDAVFYRIQLPWQLSELIQDALLEPFEKLHWQLCDWVRATLQNQNR